MVGKTWTRDDHRFLRMNAALMPPDKLADALGRSVGAVRTRARQKKIRLLLDQERGDALASERDARIRTRPI